MIELDRQDDIYVMRMKNGENRFNRDSIRALGDALDEVEGSKGSPGLVTMGEGKFYSNGLDLDWMGSDDCTEGQLAFVGTVLALFARLLIYPLPTAAAMNGHAYAGGLMMALAHDSRVMRADRGYVCLPELNLGMPLHPGMTVLIQSRLPKQTAHEAIVSARRYGGVEAFEAGIVQEASDEALVLERSIERVKPYIGKSREAMAALKRGLYPAALEALANV